MIKVLNIKDVIKYLVKLSIILLIIVGVTRFFSNIKEGKVNLNETKIVDIKFSEIRKAIIENVLSNIIPNPNEQEFINLDENIIEKILNFQLGMAKNIVLNENFTMNESNIMENDIIEEAKIGLETQVIEDNTVSNKYTNNYGSVQIKNESDKELTESILNPNIQLSNLKDILIFHTHTCESYTTSEKFYYEPTGNYRTTDLNFSVSRVGDELNKYLASYGYNVIHNKSYHDYPAYTGSYSRSLVTVKNELKIKPETEIIFDLHRDAIGSNPNYAPKVKIGDEYAAQIMFVIGTDGGGLTHPNWQENLKFAIKVQEKANELYPGLFKPIILRNSRYNQHVSKAAGIIEVGATGNTLEECLVSMKYFSKVISEVVK